MCSVPRFSSSTECWTFHLGTSLVMHSAHCAQDRGVPQVQVLGMVLSAWLLCNNRCRGRLLLVDAWFDRGYIFRVYLGAVWKNFTYFLREGGTLILKLTLRPALHSRSGQVCTVDDSIAEQLHLEIWTVFPMNPLHSADFCSAVGRLH